MLLSSAPRRFFGRWASIFLERDWPAFCELSTFKDGGRCFLPVELPAGVAVLPLPWTELFALGFKLTPVARAPVALDAALFFAPFCEAASRAWVPPLLDTAVAVLPLAVEDAAEELFSFLEASFAPSVSHTDLVPILPRELLVATDEGESTTSVAVLPLVG